MAGRGANDRRGRFSASGNETVRLVIDYVKQETLDPLKGLGRFVAAGIAGSVALAAGVVVLSVGLLRLLQTETGSAFTGNLSWLPYVICAVVLVAVGASAAVAIGRGPARRMTEAGRTDRSRNQAPAPTPAEHDSPATPAAEEEGR